MKNLEWKCRLAVTENTEPVLALAFVRYETVRKLNPRQFQELCEANIRHGMPFDNLIDTLADEKPTY